MNLTNNARNIMNFIRQLFCENKDAKALSVIALLQTVDDQALMHQRMLVLMICSSSQLEAWLS